MFTNCVSFARSLQLNIPHITAYMKPWKCNEAVKSLKNIQNPFYKNIAIDELEEDVNDDSFEEYDDPQPDDIDQNTTDDEDEPNEDMGQVIKDQSTCLVPMNQEAKLVINDENNTNVNDFQIAPGEGKIPTNYLREKHFDVRAYPTLHPTGAFGLHHTREIPISCQEYFGQRLNNADERFSRHGSYIFAAQYFVERNQLENQISISGQRGSIKNSSDQVEKKIRLKDILSVLQKVRGSDRYWKLAR